MMAQLARAAFTAAPFARAQWVVLCATVAALLALAPRSHAADDLESAYQREFAFLEAEKHTLEQRIAELKSQHQDNVTAARAAIDALQGQVMAAALRSDRVQESLLEAERQADAVGEGEDVADSLLNQMDVALEKSDRKLPAVDPAETEGVARIKQLNSGFAQAMAALREASNSRIETGPYFDGQGQKQEGRILRLGDVAAFGLVEGAQGALAPAGGGKLEVWPEPKAKLTAAQWARGKNPDTLNLFLFESLEKRIDPKAEKTVVEVIDSGGVIGWVIVAGGAIALLLALLRFLLLSTSAANTARSVEKLKPLVEQKRFAEAADLARQIKGSLGRVLTATLSHIDKPREELEDRVEEAVLHEQPRLDRFGNAIFVIAAVAPLLGLLGTVTGMIATFDIITEFGTGNPKLLSNGISIALVTTELGLVVAIPALLLGNFLNGWAESVKDDLDRAALGLTNLAKGGRIPKRPTEGTDSSVSLPGRALAAS